MDMRAYRLVSEETESVLWALFVLERWNWTFLQETLDGDLNFEPFFLGIVHKDPPDDAFPLSVSAEAGPVAAVSAALFQAKRHYSRRITVFTTLPQRLWGIP